MKLQTVTTNMTAHIRGKMNQAEADGQTVTAIILTKDEFEQLKTETYDTFRSDPIGGYEDFMGVPILIKEK